MDRIISMLIKLEPYYATLLQQCNIRWTDLCPTAGVRILPGNLIEFLVNPEFFLMLSDERKIGLVMHELKHLVYGHPIASRRLNHKIANIAMDEAINQTIPRRYLPTSAILPHIFGHKENLSFYEYYNLIYNSKIDVNKYQQSRKYEGGADDNRQIEENLEKIGQHLKNIAQIQELLKKKINEGDAEANKNIMDQSDESEILLSSIKDKISKKNIKELYDLADKVYEGNIDLAKELN